MPRGIIFDVKEFSLNDGPGIRTTIFFKGCPLHCAWCHNPEGIDARIQLKEAGAPCLGCGQCRAGCTHADCAGLGRCLHVCPLGRLNACGREVDAGDLARQIKRQARFLELNEGGVTLSGGEPLAQPDFLFALMPALKPLHLAVETSAFAAPAIFEKMIRLADLVMVDLKHMHSPTHRRYTGVGNERILSNLRLLMASDRPFIARIPLIPGVNDDPANLESSAAFLSGAKTLVRVELLPYNVLAGAKYRAVGLEYRPGFAVDAAPNIDLQPFTSCGIEALVL